MLAQGFTAIAMGDLLMQCLYRTRPYEAEPGAADALFDHWMEFCRNEFRHGMSRRTFKKTVKQIVNDFDMLPLVNDRSKPRVGVVGEILVKFHPTANNEVVKVLESEGCEAVVPGLMEFFLFGIAGRIFQHDPLGREGAGPAKLLLKMVRGLRAPINAELAKSQRFEVPTDIFTLADYAKEILSLCNSMGEGWLLTAEMIELVQGGYGNIVCAQPFGCLPNHIVGKGMINKIRALHPDANITPVDYDPSATRVNQENRIKLMLAVAREKLDQPGEVQPVTAEQLAGGAPQVETVVR